MTECKALRAEVEMLVDGELADDLRVEMMRHMQTCAPCRMFFEQAKLLSQQIRAAKEEVRAPDVLRSRVEQLISERARSMHAVSGQRPDLRRRLGWSLAAAAVVLMIFGVVGIARNSSQRGGAALVQAAIQSHEALVGHRLQLGIATESNQAAADWLNTRTPFHFQIANAGIANDAQAKYRLEGASLADVEGKTVAVLSFRMPGEAISMVVGPGKYSVNKGDSVVYSDGIALYSRRSGDLHLVSWKNRGLSYVLVSPMSMGSPSSCVHCHAGAAAGRTQNARLPYDFGMEETAQYSAVSEYLASSQQGMRAASDKALP